jgi:hypothetical protein
MTDRLTSTFCQHVLGLLGVWLCLGGLVACTSAQTFSLVEAQAALADAWQADQHTRWELDWPVAPIGGPVTFEFWQAGSRYRYEVLEASAPALVGQTLVFDSRTAWLYNRLEPTPPEVLAAPALSPVTDVVTLIDRLVAATPQTASRESVHLTTGLAQKISAVFTNGDQLTLWRDEATGLPVRLEATVNNRPVWLQARSFNPLINPPEALFKPLK